jgi:hypothetical protein
MAICQTNEERRTQGRRVTGSNSDGLVVLTEQLHPIVIEWLKKHNAEFPAIKSGHGIRTKHFMSGLDYIVAQRPELSARAVYRITSLETKFTTLFVADSVLTAIEETSAFYDGRVQVIPNPGWTQERWLEWKAEQGCI